MMSGYLYKNIFSNQKGRILSSKLLVLSIKEEREDFNIVLEDEEAASNEIENELNPDDTFELFHKWQGI